MATNDSDVPKSVGLLLRLLLVPARTAPDG